MWTVEPNFERLWLNLGLIFNTSEVCCRLPAHKNFIATISKHHTKWGKTFGQRRKQFCEYLWLVIIKHAVKKNMLILSGSITSVHMTKARIWTRISARVGIFIYSHFIFIFATH